MMPLTRRQLLRGVTALAAAGLGSGTLAACVATTTPAPTEPTAPAEAATEPPATGEAFTLELMLDFDPTYITFSQENLDPQLKEMYPGATVEIVPLDWSRLEEQLLTSKAAGTMPDLFRMGASFVAIAADNELALVLDDRLDAWGQRDDFYAGALGTCQWNGKTWGLPQLTSPRHYCYRKDLSDDAGVTIADDWDWDQYLEAAIAATKYEGDKIVQMGSSVDRDLQEFIGVLVSGGGSLLKGGKAAFNSEAGIWALGWIKERNNSVAPEGFAPLAESPIPYLATGQVVIQYGHPGYWYTQVKTHAPDKADFVTVPMPPIKAARVAMTNTDWIAVGVTTKHADAAWDLLKLHMSAEALIAFNEGIGYLPPRKSAADQAEYLKGPQLAKVAQNMEAFGIPFAITPGYVKFDAVIRPMIEAVVLGQQTVEEGLAEAEKEINDIMEDYPDWPDT